MIFMEEKKYQTANSGVFSVILLTLCLPVPSLKSKAAATISCIYYASFMYF